ncbi:MULTISPECIES: hypothetical protein [Caldilinea]|jgi:hypothetical protein|uniref:Uncharacterized protein n=1 Tax=Caldilinea aerophila (strain DSM 14535 / JCM 11387 / NBRC 104270 / STL-6-O1) TaxID=926550 RepID=I0HZH2_CALAS|nr:MULTISPECIES: hypothetical protein [Caldilinea]MBO9391398.1 hypothetical protein [Caldilinea sp.]BAL98409.1 hypothetical protein CLDAP_03700 [Caldilinea aerophila DSM 14535 = NBRC 104270]GIV75007.1 MAG: hypothetical protein KatS3mg049_3563 [Caldilinea sp.]
MNLFARLLAALRSKGAPGADRYLSVYVFSHRCREPIKGQIDLLNELSLAEEESGYYVRKVLHTSGRNRCFAQVEVQLWLDDKKQVTRYEVQGGRWLTAEEYAAELERQAQAESASETKDASETEDKR